MSSAKEALKAAHEKNWDSSAVSLYVIKRSLNNKKASYRALHVNVNDGLRGTLRSAALKGVNESGTARRWTPTSTDLDGDVLSMAISQSDFEDLVALLESDQQSASSMDELVGSWMYVIRLDGQDGKPLYAVRRVSTSWAARKVRQPVVNMIFENNMLVDSKNQEILPIDDQVDFFAYDDFVFIKNKGNFEALMNFRVDLEADRDAVVKELDDLNLVHDSAVFKNAVGSNMRYLRRLSQVRDAGYYKDHAYMTKLQKVSNQEKWGLEFDDQNRLVISDENIDLVLKTLNNDRLHSKINDENFDVDVKHKL